MFARREDDSTRLAWNSWSQTDELTARMRKMQVRLLRLVNGVYNDITVQTVYPIISTA